MLIHSVPVFGTFLLGHQVQLVHVFTAAISPLSDNIWLVLVNSHIPRGNNTEGEMSSNVALCLLCRILLLCEIYGRATLCDIGMTSYNLRN